MDDTNVPDPDSCCTAAIDCTGWADACPDLQTVLDNVASGDQIWVAAGTYKPTKPVGARAETFALASCLKIYGGFDGTEVPGMFDLDTRNFVMNETILSGDLDGDDNSAEFPNGPSFSDNSFHVVSAGSSSSVDETAILDGFTVTKGNANVSEMGEPNGSDKGGAVSIWINSTPGLENCTFLENYALDHGAGVNDHGGATLTDCVFRDNTADSHAAGLYVHDDIATTVTNCDFYDNTAVNEGGGAYIKIDGDPSEGPDPTFTDCTFSGNQAIHGGGMYCGIGRSPSVIDCTFSNNSASGPGLGLRSGGGMYNDSASPLVDGCRFSGNTAYTNGGAIYNNVCSFPTITDCTFSDNSAVSGSGVYNFKGSDTLFVNCTFTGHHTTVRNGYGSGIYNFGASPIIRNCDFVDGLARYGGGMYSAGSDGVGGGDPQPEGPDPPECLVPYAGTFVPADPQIINCRFVDNEAGMIGISSGGAIFAEGRGSVTLTNCLFARNRETLAGSYPGGAFTYFDPVFEDPADPQPEEFNELTMTNCTFVANTATGDAGGLYSRSPTNNLYNCVFWDNVADSDGTPHSDESAQILLDPAYNAEATDGYNDIMNLVQVSGAPFCDDEFGTPSCEGNIDALPQFVDPLSGAWSLPAPTYNSITDETTFTDNTPPLFVDGALVGAILNPNTTQARVSIITANSTTTVTALSDLRGIGAEGNPYQIDDYHLKFGSPCIDRADGTAVPPDVADLDDDGDPDEQTPVDLDPKPRFIDDPDTPDDFGVPSPEHPFDFVDIGAYEFAPDCGTCPTDVDGDGDTDAFDLAFLLGFWGEPITEADALCLDANGDLRIGSFDLGSLLGNWGLCP